MSAVPAELLESPLLVEIHDQIERTLAAEKKAREAFRSRAGDGIREEFINGEVIEQVSTRDAHMAALDNIHLLIKTFVRLRKLGAVRREQALTEFPRNDYCPDLCYWNSNHAIGSDPDQLIYPPPDLVVEVISPGTEKRDRGIKFQDYEAHGVAEYWIVDPDKKVVEQFVTRDGKYHRVFADSAGSVSCGVIPGLVLPVAAVFDDDEQLAVLQAILSGN